MNPGRGDKVPYGWSMFVMLMLAQLPRRTAYSLTKQRILQTCLCADRHAKHARRALCMAKCLRRRNVFFATNSEHKCQHFLSFCRRLTDLCKRLRRYLRKQRTVYYTYTIHCGKQLNFRTDDRVKVITISFAYSSKSSS